MTIDFKELARDWLVRAQGHARAPHEDSLAKELQRVFDLGRQAGPEPVCLHGLPECDLCTEAEDWR